MFTAHPTPRLRHAAIGQCVTLADCPDNRIDRRALTVAGVRSDGYYELTINGQVKSIASPGHKIEVQK